MAKIAVCSMTKSGFERTIARFGLDRSDCDWIIPDKMDKLRGREYSIVAINEADKIPSDFAERLRTRGGRA